MMPIVIFAVATVVIAIYFGKVLARKRPKGLLDGLRRKSLA